MDGSPFITLSGWKTLIMNEENLKENAAKQTLKDDPKRMVGRLITQKIIRKDQKGFLVIDPELIERLLGDSKEE